MRPVLRCSPSLSRQEQREANGYKNACQNGYKNGGRLHVSLLEEFIESMTVVLSSGTAIDTAAADAAEQLTRKSESSIADLQDSYVYSR